MPILLLGHPTTRRMVLGTAADSPPLMPRPYEVTIRFKPRIELPVDGLAASVVSFCADDFCSV